MDALWELCNTDDFGALVCLTMLANFVGHRMAGENTKACRLSWRFAGGTFLLYCCIRIMQEGATEPLPLCAIAIRGIVAAAFIAGLTLIVLAPLLLLGGRLMAGWGAVKQRVSAWTGARNKQLQTTREQQAERQRQQQWDATAVERQKLHEESAQAALAEAKQFAADKRRREAARLVCQLKWDQHARVLNPHFPRDRVAEYFNHFMTAEHSPEEVEARADQLVKVLDAILVAYGGDQRERHFSTHTELAEHFRQRRVDISNAGYDAETGETLLAMAVIEERKALEEMLRT